MKIAQRCSKTVEVKHVWWPTQQTHLWVSLYFWVLGGFTNLGSWQGLVWCTRRISIVPHHPSLWVVIPEILDLYEAISVNVVWAAIPGCESRYQESTAVVLACRRDQDRSAKRISIIRQFECKSNFSDKSKKSTRPWHQSHRSTLSVSPTWQIWEYWNGKLQWSVLEAWGPCPY